MCQECVKHCPTGALRLVKGKGVVTDYDKCRLCGACAEVCPTKAMEMAVTRYSPEQIVNEIEKERPFFESSGGGVTFSGGEPLLAGEALLELLDMCEGRFHRTIDTTLFAAPELVEKAVRKSELLLVDLKIMDREKHKKFCGVDNALILDNIKMISEMGASFIVRIPFIAGINADDENIEAAADFLASVGYGGRKASPLTEPMVELLPYHDIGKGKHFRLGTRYNPDAIPMSVPTEKQLDRAVGIFASRGIYAKY